MRTLLLFIALVATFSTAAYAQNDACQPDFTAVDEALNQARSAADTDAALAAVREARSALDLIDARCANYAPETAGDRRSNPVPLGQEKVIDYGSYGKYSLKVTQVMTGDEADELMGYAPDDGNKFIVVEVEVVCGTDVDTECSFTSSSVFTLVGSQGTVRRAGFASNADTSVTLFGGGQATFYIPFEVPEEDSDFVLFDDLTPQVFFALE